MKFSYRLIKKILPKAPRKEKLISELNLKSFETENLADDSIEIAVPPNRYSDAASHWGIVKEVAAIFNLKIPFFLKEIVNPPENRGFVKVSVKDKDICPRYIARYFEVKKIARPPEIQEFLKACGLKSINGIVDIMNYVMLEVGQPLHAFDAEKVRKDKNFHEIIVRFAKKGEKIKTLDNQVFDLSSEDIVIADKNKILALAGIKGGKEAEITETTKKIVVESATFDPVSIFKTSRRIGLNTDASLRFSHGLNPALAGLGMDRATALLQEAGAKLIDSFDYYPKPANEEVIEFDVKKFNELIGGALSPQKIIDYLKRLGFEIKKKGKERFLVETPILRQDIENFNGLAEEVARLSDYNLLPSKPPHVGLGSAKEEEMIVFKDKIRQILIGFGLDEVYNYSLLPQRQTGVSDKNLVFLKNPLGEFEILRPTLETGLIENSEDNARFFDRFQVFEIGKVFRESDPILEKWSLGLALVGKKENRFLELKGFIDELLKRLGLIDYFFKEASGVLRIETDNLVLGELKIIEIKKDYAVALAEIKDLERLMGLTEGEKEFEPLPKYPAVIRDLSFLVDFKYRISEIEQKIYESSLRYIENVDLIDEYSGKNLPENLRSLTFRMVFQAKDRTLKNEEVGDMLAKIISVLEGHFDIELR